jgi:hypothetical protein
MDHTKTREHLLARLRLGAMSRSVSSAVRGSNSVEATGSVSVVGAQTPHLVLVVEIPVARNSLTMPRTQPFSSKSVGGCDRMWPAARCHRCANDRPVGLCHGDTPSTCGSSRGQLFEHRGQQ